MSNQSNLLVQRVRHRQTVEMSSDALLDNLNKLRSLLALRGMSDVAEMIGWVMWWPDPGGRIPPSLATCHALAGTLWGTWDYIRGGLTANALCSLPAVSLSGHEL